MRIALVILITLFELSLFALIGTFSYSSSLEENLDLTKSRLASREEHIQLATTLMSHPWYCLNDTTVSSEKEGKGEVVNLHMNVGFRTRYGQENMYGVKIKFIPVQPPTTLTYTIRDYIVGRLIADKDN